MISTCGCCTDPVAPTPLLVYNRPSLTAIQYRIGTYASFREAMIDQISSISYTEAGVTLRPLVNWASRDSGDLGIAVIEMWAYLADILTFYQERTANEAYLRTAILREDVLRLAALLGYVPAPGLAASVLLAFTLENARQLQIPLGLKVQSVPGQNQKPQKFETIESVAVDAIWNNVRVFPPPQPYDPLALASTFGILNALLVLVTPLVPGNDLVVFLDKGPAEDKKVDSIVTADGRATLNWSPALTQSFSSGHLFRWTRKMRLFGGNAPAQYLVATPNAGSPIELDWSQKNTDFTLAAPVSTLALDAAYNDLKSAQRLLVQTPGGSSLVTITAVTQVTATVGPLSGVVTEVTISPPLAVDVDLRSVVVYLLAEPEITFDTSLFVPAITGNTVFLQSGAALAADKQIVPQRSVILNDKNNNPQAVTVTDASLNGAFLAITFTPALSPALDAATAFLYGNVALSTHGETVAAEVLGDGDASAAFQTFTLAKSPVTFVPQAGAPNGAGTTLQVLDDGVKWKEVPSFYSHGPNERVYVTSRDNNEVMSVTAGDGLTGAPFTTGRANIVANYRYGLGSVGNVIAGAIKNLLDRPVGLKSVINPLAAAGGADPETLDHARSQAPTTVRTFGRIVSLLDFEDAALAYPGIAKARAAWNWDGLEQAVQLTVAGDDDTIITGQVLKNLIADLNSRRDPNRKLTVLPHRPVAIIIAAAILVDTGNYVASEVQTSVAQALAAYFAFDNVNLGQAVHSSEIYAAIQNVTGVLGADVDTFQYKYAADRASHGATSDDRQPVLIFFGNELPAIEDTVNDITVTLGLE